VTSIVHCVCEINQTVTAIGMLGEERQEDEFHEQRSTCRRRRWNTLV